MNKEGISSNGNSNTETLEKQEQPPATLETKESGQEFANKILNKIKDYMSSFTSKKEAMEKIESTVSFDDPTVKERIKSEINLDNQIDEIDTEIQKTKTEASENVNLTVSNFSKAYHHPEYRDKIAKDIVEARKSGQDTEIIRSGFYDKTSSEKENFESQEKERSVAEIMKEKDMVIVHGIALLNNNAMDNNTVIDSKKINFEESCKLIMGLEPTLSTSIPSPDRGNNGLAYKQGIILGEGKVLSASALDASSVALSIKKRIAMSGTQDNFSHDSAIQSKINIEEIVSDQGPGKPWNELVVENPKIAGLFIDMTLNEKDFDPDGHGFELQKNDGSDVIKLAEESKKNFLENQNKALIEMRKQSERLEVPLYVFKNEEGKLNKYKVNFEEHPEYSGNYIKEVILPKMNDKFSKDENGKFILNPDYIKFINEEVNPIRNYIKNGDRKYTLEKVTAEDIYNTKPEISEENKIKITQDLKNKKILS